MNNMKEKEVQKVLKEWFENKGFKVIENVKVNSENCVDLVATKENEKWIIEVKGDYDRNTAQYNVNFDTGMGQLLKSITIIDDKTKYAICIPFYAICIPFSRTERGEKLSYRLILKKYSKSIIFEMLNIHLILIRDDKSVEIISPANIIKFLTSINPKIKRR